MKTNLIQIKYSNIIILIIIITIIVIITTILQVSTSFFDWQAAKAHGE